MTLVPKGKALCRGYVSELCMSSQMVGMAATSADVELRFEEGLLDNSISRLRTFGRSSPDTGESSADQR